MLHRKWNFENVIKVTIKLTLEKLAGEPDLVTLVTKSFESREFICLLEEAEIRTISLGKS